MTCGEEIDLGLPSRSQSLISYCAIMSDYAKTVMVLANTYSLWHSARGVGNEADSLIVRYET